MFKAIRARFVGAYVAILTMTVVALAFLAPTQADARVGGFSGGGRSFSSARAYSVPRMVIAPRVIIAPRPIFTPRPVIVVRPSFYPRPWYRPVIIPFVAPAMVVAADGQAQGPVVVERSGGHYVLMVLLLIVLIVLICGGLGYGGYCYYGSGAFFVEDMICADLAVDMFCGDYL